ncbi:MAG TPA: NAD-dependent epimerase/dehydratase family protein, partial [Blastocatellia bacterium]|nr:NAD-dependent epimerase/dehydratase family protein [Blastocatellia bacterium]
MKILITGATGLIGRSVCRSLINEGHQLVALSRRSPAAPVVMDLAGVIAFQWEPAAESP